MGRAPRFPPPERPERAVTPRRLPAGEAGLPPCRRRHRGRGAPGQWKLPMLPRPAPERGSRSAAGSPADIRSGAAFRASRQSPEMSRGGRGRNSTPFLQKVRSRQIRQPRPTSGRRRGQPASRAKGESPSMHDTGRKEGRGKRQQAKGHTWPFPRSISFSRVISYQRAMRSTPRASRSMVPTPMAAADRI